MKLNLKVKGSVRMQFHDRDGNLVNTIEKDNAIQPTAKAIVAHLLANREDGKINYMQIYRSGGLIYQGLITTVTNPSDTEVEFTSLFPAGGFSGTFDEARLGSDIGDFSKLTGFVATKDAGNALTVSWKISVIDCS